MATTESEAPQTTTVDDAPDAGDEVVLTVTETAIAKILEREPDWSAFPHYY